jgi:hypothetical protein
LLGFLTQSFFGHFLVREFFNSHACLRQSAGNETSLESTAARMQELLYGKRVSTYTG